MEKAINDSERQQKLEKIKAWLKTGSINIFGLPMSGKDTQGVALARALGAKFLSSGLIIRAMEKSTNQDFTGKGALLPTNIFYEWVLPYFERRELWNFPLVLSSIGRWFGEETEVMSVAEGAGHPIKAVVILNVSEADVTARWQAAKVLNDRGERPDDQNFEAFKTRLNEFREKTAPVIEHYNELGLLVKVNGDQSREAVFAELIDRLYDFCITSAN